MRKKHIRWDRVVLLLIIVLLPLIFIVRYVEKKQEENRQSLYVDTIVDGKEYTLTCDEFIEYKKNRVLPVVSSYEKELIVEIPVEEEEEPTLEYLGSFLLTGYCDCVECQEEWVGTTAMGIAPTVNNTVAVDPDLIPLGSYLIIDGVRYHAEDVGGMIQDQHIDIFVGSHSECYSDFCNGYHDVYLEVK